MIVAEQKPMQEILDMLPEEKKVLVVGCDTCVTVCMAGGEKEVKVLVAALKLSEKSFPEVNGVSIERQCDKEFVEEIIEQVNEHDIILSMACGAGVQMMADFFPEKTILPALNTLFMGSNEGAGYWLERCLGCGDCVLGITAGICPRTRCSKGLMNGPCGGSENGKCEVDPENLDCAWNLIYQRLKARNRLDDLLPIQPPQDWSKSHDGGPRRLIREDVNL
jgi:ferredoxin